MATYLGVDAGGTGTAWLALDDQGAVRARGQGPAVQVSTMGLSAASSRLRALLTGICAELVAGPPTAAVAGVAGAGDDRTRTALERDGAAALAAPLRVTGDPVVAAAAALADHPGVALWAGTGSFAVARTAAGSLVRVGGRGHLLGDRGSAHHLVIAAAAAVVAAADGLAPATALSGRLVERFAARSPQQLGVAMQHRSVGEIAAALPEVLAVARRGDAVATELIAAGARDLVDLAVAAAERAGLPLVDTTIALGGGVLVGGGGAGRHRSEIADRVATALSARGVGAVELAERDGAHGAALLARAVDQRLAPMADWLDHGAA